MDNRIFETKVDEIYRIYLCIARLTHRTSIESLEFLLGNIHIDGNQLIKRSKFNTKEINKYTIDIKNGIAELINSSNLTKSEIKNYFDMIIAIDRFNHIIVYAEKIISHFNRKQYLYQSLISDAVILINDIYNVYIEESNKTAKQAITEQNIDKKNEQWMKKYYEQLHCQENKHITVEFNYVSEIINSFSETTKLIKNIKQKSRQTICCANSTNANYKSHKQMQPN